MTEQEFIAQKIPTLLKEGYKRNQAFMIAKSMYTKQYAQQAINPFAQPEVDPIWNRPQPTYTKQPNTNTFGFPMGTSSSKVVAPQTSPQQVPTAQAAPTAQPPQNYGQFSGDRYGVPQGIDYNFNSQMPAPQNPFENSGYANYAQTLEQNNPLPQSDFRGYQQYNTADPNFKPSDVLKAPTQPTAARSGVDTTQQRNEVNIINPFDGVSLDQSLMYAGQGFGEKDPFKAGIGTSLSLLKGARGFMSGYANGTESRRVAQANQDAQFEQNRNYTYTAQQGGSPKLTNAENLTGQFLGNNPQGNVNAENGEFMKKYGSVPQEVVGDPHVENGKESHGTDVVAREGDKFLSNTKILPIGAKNAKDLKDRYDISVKAKDTFASVQKKVDSKIGYKKETEELASWIEKFGDNEKLKDKTTKELNAPIIEKSMLASKAKIEALNDVRGMVFEDLYNRQEQIPKKGRPGDLFTDSGKLVTEKNEEVAQQGGLTEDDKIVDYQPDPNEMSDEEAAKFMDVYNEDQKVYKVWEQKTGMSWKKAKELGYTDGSVKDNMKLLSELNNPRFKKENLRTAPTNNKPQAQNNNKSTPSVAKQKVYSYQDFQNATKNIPKGNGSQDNIGVPDDDNMVTRVGERMANPFQAFGHYAKYGEMPAEGFSKNEKNNYDRALGIVNPLYWANAAGNATDFAEEGEYMKATMEALDALPALGKLKYIKNLPIEVVNKIPGARALLQSSTSTGLAKSAKSAVDAGRRVPLNFYEEPLRLAPNYTQIGSGAKRLGFQQGGEQEGGQAMAIISAYAEASGQDPQALAEQIGQMQPEEQAQALQQMAQELQGGQEQGEQNQSGQEGQQEEMTAQQGGLMDMASKYGVSLDRAQELVSMQQGGGKEKATPQRITAADVNKINQNPFMEFTPEFAKEYFSREEKPISATTFTPPTDKKPIRDVTSDGLFTDRKVWRTQNPEWFVGKQTAVEGKDYTTIPYSQWKAYQNSSEYKAYMGIEDRLAEFQQGGEKEYYQLAGKYTAQQQKERLGDYYTHINGLGYTGVKDIGKMQNWMAENYPQEVTNYFTKNGQPLTAKHVDIIKSKYKNTFKETGISENKKSEDYTAEEKLKLQTALGDKATQEFLLEGFQDNKWDWRFPMVGTNFQAKGMANAPQIQAPTTTTDMSKFYSTSKEVAVQVDAKGQPMPQESADENGVKNYMPSFPVDLRMPPSALQAINKPYVPFGRQEPIKATAEPMLAEQERLRQVDLERINQTGLSPQQMEALSASGLASSQMASNDAIGKVENFNAQNQFQTDQFNLQQRTKEDMTNAQFSQKYQDQMLGSMANTERDWRNFYTEGNLQNRMNYNYIENANLLNAKNEQYAVVPGQGVIFKNNQSQNLAIPSSILQETWDKMTAEEQNAWRKNKLTADKKKSYLT